MAEIGISRRASTGLTWLCSTGPLIHLVIFRFCYFEGKEGRRKSCGRKKERERGQREERKEELKERGREGDTRWSKLYHTLTIFQGKLEKQFLMTNHKLIILFIFCDIIPGKRSWERKSFFGSQFERYSLLWREMHDAERGISCGSTDTRQLVTLDFKSWLRERWTHVLSLLSSFSPFESVSYSSPWHGNMYILESSR